METCIARMHSSNKAYGSGFMMLSSNLYSIFVRYIRLGRIRAPPAQELFELSPTFQSGAKTDRRALQSKFKSWAKRMALISDRLVMANTGKFILPREHCEAVIKDIHFQNADGHLTIDEVISEIQKVYTWSRKNFGMDWHIVASTLPAACDREMCMERLNRQLCNQQNARNSNSFQNASISNPFLLSESGTQVLGSPVFNSYGSFSTRRYPTISYLTKYMTTPLDSSNKELSPEDRQKVFLQKLNLLHREDVEKRQISTTNESPQYTASRLFDLRTHFTDFDGTSAIQNVDDIPCKKMRDSFGSASGFIIEPIDDPKIFQQNSFQNEQWGETGSLYIKEEYGNELHKRNRSEEEDPMQNKKMRFLQLTPYRNNALDNYDSNNNIYNRNGNMSPASIERWFSPIRFRSSRVQEDHKYNKSRGPTLSTPLFNKAIKAENADNFSDNTRECHQKYQNLSGRNLGNKDGSAPCLEIPSRPKVSKYYGNYAWDFSKIPPSAIRVDSPYPLNKKVMPHFGDQSGIWRPDPDSMSNSDSACEAEKNTPVITSSSFGELMLPNRLLSNETQQYFKEGISPPLYFATNARVTLSDSSSNQRKSFKIEDLSGIFPFDDVTEEENIREATSSLKIKFTEKMMNKLEELWKLFHQMELHFRHIILAICIDKEDKAALVSLRKEIENALSLIRETRACFTDFGLENMQWNKGS